MPSRLGGMLAYNATAHTEAALYRKVAKSAKSALFGGFWWVHVFLTYISRIQFFFGNLAYLRDTWTYFDVSGDHGIR